MSDITNHCPLCEDFAKRAEQAESSVEELQKALQSACEGLCDDDDADRWVALYLDWARSDIKRERGRDE